MNNNNNNNKKLKEHESTKERTEEEQKLIRIRSGEKYFVTWIEKSVSLFNYGA